MELIEYLLQVGADVNLRDPDGDTPLLVAESPYVFERLIEAGGLSIWIFLIIIEAYSEFPSA